MVWVSAEPFKATRRTPRLNICKQPPTSPAKGPGGRGGGRVFPKGGGVRGGGGGGCGGTPPVDPELLEACRTIFWPKLTCAKGEKFAQSLKGGGVRGRGGGGCQTPPEDAELLSKTRGGGASAGKSLGMRCPPQTCTERLAGQAGDGRVSVGKADRTDFGQSNAHFFQHNFFRNVFAVALSLPPGMSGVACGCVNVCSGLQPNAAPPVPALVPTDHTRHGTERKHGPQRRWRWQLPGQHLSTARTVRQHRMAMESAIPVPTDLVEYCGLCIRPQHHCCVGQAALSYGTSAPGPVPGRFKPYIIPHSGKSLRCLKLPHCKRATDRCGRQRLLLLGNGHECCAKKAADRQSRVCRHRITVLIQTSRHFKADLRPCPQAWEAQTTCQSLTGAG